MPRYPDFTEDQSELINYSRSFLSKALNSPYYQLFKQTNNSHILLEPVQKYANEFVRNLTSQRPYAFPEELRKKVKIESEEYVLGLVLSSNSSSDGEKSKEPNPEEEGENQEDEFEVKGLWEDGIENNSMDSEEII
jgi:hypothetical protein